MGNNQGGNRLWDETSRYLLYCLVNTVKVMSSRSVNLHILFLDRISPLNSPIWLLDHVFKGDVSPNLQIFQIKDIVVMKVMLNKRPTGHCSLT